MALYLFVALYLVFSVGAVAAPRLAETNWVTGLGLSLLLSIGIAIYYAAARAIVAHRSLHLRHSAPWITIDRVLIPLTTWLLYFRHSGLEPQQALLDVWLIGLLVVLLDPTQLVWRSLRESRLLASGRFLRPVVPVKPRSGFDYLFLMICLGVLYWRLLR